MRASWKTVGLVVAALAIAFAVVGCSQKQQASSQSKDDVKPTQSATHVVPPPPDLAVPPEPKPAAAPAPAPTPAPQQKGGKMAESAAVQAARKLGTPTDKPVVTTPSGLQYIEVKEGQGEAAKAGDTVKVHYTGWLENGTSFDSSLKRGQPFSFPLGAGRVIRGWDEGVAGMKPGGVRKLIIPPQLGYGPNGMPPVIPANATLIFEVQYLGK